MSAVPKLHKHQFMIWLSQYIHPGVSRARARILPIVDSGWQHSNLHLHLATRESSAAHVASRSSALLAMQMIKAFVPRVLIADARGADRYLVARV